MTFPILGGNSAVGGYSIDNSLRFNDNDSARLARTPSSTQTSNQIGTLSYWVKRSTLGTAQFPWHFYPNRSGHSNDRTFQAFDTSDRLTHERIYTGSTQFRLRTNRLFRDVGAWYHIVLAIDTTQATASNRMKLYVNGVQETDFETATYPPQNEDIDIFEQILTTIGVGYSAGAYTGYFDGYLAEFYGIDGQQLSPTDFGEFDTDSGIWKPKQFSGSYGTNGFYLDFENSGSLGADQSGNGNNFTPTNLASTDQTTDTPTNNWCTLNPLDTPSGSTFSEGNLKINTNTSQQGFTRSTFAVSQGKWYFETKITTSNVREAVGIVLSDATLTDNSKAVHYYSRFGHVLKGNTLISTQATFGNNDKIGVAFNLDDNTVAFYKNGTLQDTVTSIDSGTYSPIFRDGSDAYTCGGILNFGNNGSFAGTETAQGNADDNGFGDFYYAPPSGYLALCTQNLATELSPTINDGSAYFQSTPYTGNGSDGYAVTNSGYSDLQPDFVWIKKRNSTSQHVLTDSSRGVTKQLFSSTNQAEQTSTEFLASFDSDGFTTNNNSNGLDTGDTNIANGDTYVAWNWKAGGGSVSNSDGSISSQVNVNQTAGFSIVTYTGAGSAGSVGHNLGKTPKMLIVKNRTDAGTDWCVYHAGNTSAPETDFLKLNTTEATSDVASIWNDTAPTSSVFTVGTSNGTNGSGDNYIAYCFAEIEGYSKFGSYTANGSTDGVFLYTAFKPAFLIVKITSTGGDWILIDNKRSDYNVTNEWLNPNSNSAEQTSSNNNCDFLSNGIKLRSNNGDFNFGSNTYIYMAFAESPFVSSSGVPVVAR